MRDFFRKVFTKRGSGTLRRSNQPGVAGDELRQRKKSYIARAEKLEQLNRPGDAMNLLKAASTTHAGDSDILRELARLLSVNKCEDEARDAYLAILREDVSDLDALENFLTLNHANPAPRGTTTEVITKLSESLPSSEEFDAEAAVFVLPSMRLMTPADQAIRRLKYSQSATARHISALATSKTDITEELASADHKLREAMVVVSLAKADYLRAQTLMSDSLGSAGLRALRQAVEKELRAKKMGEASELLTRFMTLNPDSAWARQVHDQITLGQKVRSQQQLTVGGFPFPDLPIDQTYQPTKRKVLYLLHNSLPYASAGYSTRSHGLMSALRSRGWRVQGVTRLGYPSPAQSRELNGFPPAPSNVIDGNKYHRLLREGDDAVAEPLQEYIRHYSDALYELALVEKPAIIHAASNHWNGLAAAIVARRLGIPSVYEVRGLWEITEASRKPEWENSGAFRFMKRMETDAAHAATRVLTITEALKTELIDRGVPASKITVVPNAVDPSRFTHIDRPADMKTKLGFEGKTIIGYVGSLVDYEGLPLLIEAVSRLASNRDDFRLLFIGDGPELKPLKHTVEKLGLTDKIIFLGEVSHHSISSYYEAIDIVALPRLALPVCEMVSPLKPFEAMASGKALVASDVAALSEIIVHGETGLLHEKESVNALTEALELLLNDPELRSKLGERASQWVKEKRSWSRVSGYVAEVYDHLLSPPSSDQQVLDELVKFSSSNESSGEVRHDAIFDLGAQNLNTYLGRRILVHSALRMRSSRYSLKVVELFAEYGLWEPVSYLARHAIPSVKKGSFARRLQAVLSGSHDLGKISTARVSIHELNGRSELVAALIELMSGSQAQHPESLLSPCFLIVKCQNSSDSSLLDLAVSLCEYLGVQLVVQEEDETGSNLYHSHHGSDHDSHVLYPGVLTVRTQGGNRYKFQKPASEDGPALWKLGVLTQKEVMEVAAVHWLLTLQASAVLKIQRTKWRVRLIESLAPLLPLSTLPGAFREVASAFTDDLDAERYIQRAASALLRTGHYLGAKEILVEIDPERRDSRYGKRAIEAAYGTADYKKVIDLQNEVGKSPRIDKILSESEAARRMLRRLETAEYAMVAKPELLRSERTLRVVSILHASVPDQIGGYANRAHALISSLRDHDIQVSAFTRPGFPDYSLPPGEIDRHSYEEVTYHRLGSRLRRETGEFAYMEESIEAYRTVLQTEQPDVVHLRSTYVSALPGLIAAKELSIPTLYEVSGMWELVYASYRDARREGLRARTVSMENAVMRHADRIVTLTEAMAAEISSRVEPKQPVTLVPNAVDLERFKPQPKREDLKASLGWQTNIPVIGYAGSLVDYEGLDVLLRAAEILERKGLQFRVLIIGDGAVKPALEHLSDELGLANTVKFTGRLPHHIVSEYYTIFDVCAFPRYLTPATRAVSPLKPFEALASAKPIVVSDIPALSEIVDHNSISPRGLAVHENDPLALAGALERLLAQSELRESLASNGLRWVREQRSWGSVSRLFAEAVVGAASSSVQYDSERRVGVSSITYGSRLE